MTTSEPIASDDRRPWFNEVYRRFIKNFDANVTDAKFQDAREEWRKHFRSVPWKVAELAADYCIRDLKKMPSVKDFAERVIQAKEKLGLFKQALEQPEDVANYINRLRSARSQIAELIKKIDYPDVHWSLIFGKVAQDVTDKIKSVKSLYPQLDEFGIYTKTKQMLNEDLKTELLARKKSQSNDRIPSSTQVAGQMQR